MVSYDYKLLISALAHTYLYKEPLRTKIYALEYV